MYNVSALYKYTCRTYIKYTFFYCLFRTIQSNINIFKFNELCISYSKYI